MISLNLGTLFTGAFIGAGIMTLEKIYPRASLKTFPALSTKFKIADSILEFFAMRFLDVFSHHWHWQNIEYTSKFDNKGLLLKGAPSGNPHNNPFFGVIAHLGGRPWGYIVKPQTDQSYFIGFRNHNSNIIRRCNIQLHQPVMLLTGPDDGCEAFAMDKNNQPLKLQALTDLIHRQGKPVGIRIL